MRLLASTVTTSFPAFAQMVPVACMSTSSKRFCFHRGRREEAGFGVKYRHSGTPAYGGSILLEADVGVSPPSVESSHSVSSVGCIVRGVRDRG
jgi:hypothetical protein